MLLLLSALAFGTPSPLTTDATSFTLDNGLTVILEPNTRTDTVGLWLRYGVAAHNEVAGEFGCAHLFEHMMFEGSAHVQGTAFDDWLTAAGGQNNAYTSEDETAYHMRFPSGALDLALFLESDRMAFLKTGLTQENLDNQIAVVLQERARGYDAPNGRDFDALTVLQFQGHPYGHSVIGTLADVGGFKLDQVTDFWTRFYRPNNATLAVVGNFDVDDAKAQVTHWFSDVPTKAAPALAVTPPYSFSPQNGLLEDEVKDRTLYLSWGTVPKGHADQPALEVASRVLSGGRGTRLDDALYYNSSLTTQTGIWNYPMALEGVFLVAASTAKEPLNTIEKAIIKQVNGLINKPATDAELSRARKAIESEMLDSLEDPLDHASVLVDCLINDQDPNCLVARMTQYNAVTSEDISRVLSTYLIPSRRTALSVVPKGDPNSLKGAKPVELK